MYGTATESIALEMPPPDGQTLDDKIILFVTYQPDGEILSAHPLPRNKILNAQLKYPKAKKKKEEVDEST